jgi:hypothetical protein
MPDTIGLDGILQGAADVLLTDQFIECSRTITSGDNDVAASGAVPGDRPIGLGGLFRS